MTSTMPTTFGWDFDQLTEEEIEAKLAEATTHVRNRKMGRPRQVHNPVQIRMILEKDMADQLDQVVEALGISRRQALRDAVRDYVKKHS